MTEWNPRYEGDTRLKFIQDIHEYKGGIGFLCVTKEEMRSDICWLLEELRRKASAPPAVS